MLTPVTTANSGRLPACDQPVSTPAPKAPSAPPPESASHGPLTLGNRRANSASESPQARASVMPGTVAACSSAAENGARSSGSLGAGGALRSIFFFACAAFCCACADCVANASGPMTSRQAARPKAIPAKGRKGCTKALQWGRSAEIQYDFSICGAALLPPGQPAQTLPSDGRGG